MIGFIGARSYRASRAHYSQQIILQTKWGRSRFCSYSYRTSGKARDRFDHHGAAENPSLIVRQHLAQVRRLLRGSPAGQCQADDLCGPIIVLEREFAEVLVFRDEDAPVGGGARDDGLIGSAGHHRRNGNDVVACRLQRGHDDR